MRTTALVVVAFTAIAWPASAASQQPRDSCATVDLKAPTLWAGAPLRLVNIRTGPGPQYPIHSSGQLEPRERIQVLQECHGWLQARVIPVRMIDGAIQQNGLARAREMLLFWVRKDLIQPCQDGQACPPAPPR